MSGTVGNRHRSPLLWAAVENETATARALVAANPALRRDVQSAGGSEAFQARSALGRALALHLLAQTASGGWTIETTERGKPIARGEVERHVSISHTGSLVAAAVSSIGPIGIDIERRDKVRDFIGLASAAFGPTEAAAVAAQGAAAFYRIWTVREAISKATGDGLPTVVDRQDRVPAELPDGKWIFGRDGWLLAHVVDAGVSLALAVRLSEHEAATVESGASIAGSRMWVEC
jgi:phosphopantetheinyl transferase